MTDFSSVVVLFAIGIGSGFLNVIAGGGSSIVLPVLIFMGMDSAAANGTNRVAILMQNISAVKSFEIRQYFELRESTKLSLWTLPGAIAGAITAVQISDELFQKILGIVMIGIVISMFVSPTSRNQEKVDEVTSRRVLIYPAMFLIGFYGGFIQVGVGFLFMAALYHILKLDLVRVNMHKVFVVLIYTIPALLIFAWTDNVNWLIGVIVGLGGALGGWWAAHVSVKKGEKLIRLALTTGILIMALKLFNVV